MDFEEWWKKEFGWGGEPYEIAKEAWNRALELAAKEVNKIALHHNTIVCAVDVINRQKTDT
jgi:hypothetical protein